MWNQKIYYCDTSNLSKVLFKIKNFRNLISWEKMSRGTPWKFSKIFLFKKNDFLNKKSGKYNFEYIEGLNNRYYTWWSIFELLYVIAEQGIQLINMNNKIYYDNTKSILQNRFCIWIKNKIIFILIYQNHQVICVVCI